MQRAYVDSWRKRLTLCIVISAVGDDEIIMIGYMVPATLEEEEEKNQVTLRQRELLERSGVRALRACNFASVSS